MSIRFPTDNDAGMSRPSAPRRPSGGGRIFSLLIFAVIAFMAVRWMSSSGPSTPVDPNPSDRSGIGSTSFPDLEADGNFEVQPGSNANQQRANRGDWAMEDGPVQRNAKSKAPSTKSSNGDWGMESVATQRDGQKPAGRFSELLNPPVDESIIKQPTTQGDWSFDSDVDTTPKPSEPKKTKNGDWGLEEVE